jgi:hypothetical protein
MLNEALQVLRVKAAEWLLTAGPEKKDSSPESSAVRVPGVWPTQFRLRAVTRNAFVAGWDKSISKPEATGVGQPWNLRIPRAIRNSFGIT